MLKYLDRLSLLGEIEIKKIISKIAQKKKGGRMKVVLRKGDNAMYLNGKEMVKQHWGEAPKDSYTDQIRNGG